VDRRRRRAFRRRAGSRAMTNIAEYEQRVDFVFLHAFDLLDVPTFAPGLSDNDRNEAVGADLSGLHAVLFEAASIDPVVA
jgi:hypothetical protein